jgi:hypothetical protein
VFWYSCARPFARAPPQNGRSYFVLDLAAPVAALTAMAAAVGLYETGLQVRARARARGGQNTVKTIR